MSLSNFPALEAIAKDLAALAATETVREVKAKRERVQVSEGRDMVRVDVPSHDPYWLTLEQREVIRALLAARMSGSDPEMKGSTLARKAGRPGATLDEVFAGTGVMGKLVIEGSREGFYRLCDIGEDE